MIDLSFDPKRAMLEALKTHRNSFIMTMHGQREDERSASLISIRQAEVSLNARLACCSSARHACSIQAALPSAEQLKLNM